VQGVDLGLELRRLLGGPLLWTLIDGMHAKRQCPDDDAYSGAEEWTEERLVSKLYFYN
jgi:hypothetical protein